METVDRAECVWSATHCGENIIEGKKNLFPVWTENLMR